MKRYISLTLAAVVLVLSLAVPSYASDNNYMQVLDYSTVNNSGTNSIGYANSIDLSWDLPYVSKLYDIEIIFESNNPVSFFRVVHGTYAVDMTITSLGDGIYRAVGSLSGYDPSRINFHVESSGLNVLNFLSVKVFLAKVNYFVTQAIGYGSLLTFNDLDIGYNVPGKEDFFHWTWGDSLLDERNFYSYFQVLNWRSFDSVSLQLYFVVQGISTISVTYGDMNVPFTVNQIDSDFGGMPAKFVTIDIDTSDLIDSFDAELEIQIMGSPYFMDYLNTIGIIGCSGIVYNSHITETATWFTNLKVWISSFQSTVSSLFSNLNGWISSQTSALQNSLFSLFSDLGNLISNMIITITNYITIWGQNVYDSVTSVGSKIETWGQNIVDAINGDASDADEFKQQVDDSNKELNDMAAVMDSFTTPDMNSINVDVGSYISPTDLSSLSAPMGMLFESNIVTTCIMISIIMGTVMFVLYGKR